MKFMITCANGLTPILNREITKFGYKVLEDKGRVVYFEGEEDAIYNINLRSRVGNKLYLQLAEGKAESFDDIFAVVNGINWSEYIRVGSPIVVKADLKYSQITSLPTTQSIAKKAIVKKMVGDDKLIENPKYQPMEVYLFLDKNILKVFLNTTGENLFKRGYRKDFGQAPLKESLASGLVMLSNWNFGKNLYDPFCGSGVIGIEAGLIAKNIAPGLNRRFAFEFLNIYNEEKYKQIKADALAQVYTGKKHNIIMSDIDPVMVQMAIQNAKKAGVDDIVTITQRDFREYNNEVMEGTLVTNPPYGVRMQDNELYTIYQDLVALFEKNKELNGSIFTSYSGVERFFNQHWKKVKMFNGDLETYLYKKFKD